MTTRTELPRPRRPILEVVLLLLVMAAAAGWLHERVSVLIHYRIDQFLQIALEANVTALNIWIRGQRDTAEAVAGETDVQRQVLAIASLGGDTAAAGDPTSGAAFRRLVGHLGTVCVHRRYEGFAVFLDDGYATWNVDGRAAWHPQPSPSPDVRETFAGTARLTRPIRRAEALPGPGDGDRPVMLALAPVRPDAVQEAVAVLGFILPPEDEFSEILQIVRFSKTGESYAVGPDGSLLSRSRFEASLYQVGLLEEGESSVLNVRVCDPGVDLRHEKPLAGAPCPPTRMLESALRGTSGRDLDGYRDYRGVPVVGAWTYLADPGIAVVTELDVAETYEPLRLLRWGLIGLTLLLSLGGGLILFGTYEVRGMRKRLGAAEQKLREYGQYTLEDLLGQGGMSSVYRASHRLMSRPVAVKILRGDQVSRVNIGRFEREVELTSHLTHPNTVTIYDYGLTPEGRFYYAMEYLDGTDLHQVIRLSGAQPEARVIHLLRQVCGSLAEAHRVGLVHRDVKAANIMICERGGVFDYVKVLDFGLVKPEQENPQKRLTTAGTAPGTPQYVAPELFLHPETADRRADIYSFGVVAYYLLTGTTPFQGSPRKLMMEHIRAIPETPSERLGRDVDSDLEILILCCLAKDPDDRPQSMEELDDGLARCPSHGLWTQADARRWWEENPESHSADWEEHSAITNAFS